MYYAEMPLICQHTVLPVLVVVEAGTAWGSGIVLTPSTVLTCGHVVQETTESMIPTVHISCIGAYLMYELLYTWIPLGRITIHACEFTIHACEVTIRACEGQR